MYCMSVLQFLVTLCLTWRASSSSKVSNNAASSITSKYYLSEVMRSISDKNNTVFATSSSLFGSPFKAPVIKNQRKKTANDAELESHCRPVYRKIRLRISDECQPLDYQVVECNGYCHSQSMVWKNQDDVQATSCCSLTGVSRRFVKMYCTRALLPDEVKPAPVLYSTSKDDDLLKLFQASFGAASWIEHFAYKSKHMYSGYYSVSLYHDASCECEYI